jgi:hypothetical protein
MLKNLSCETGLEGFLEGFVEGLLKSNIRKAFGKQNCKHLLKDSWRDDQQTHPGRPSEPARDYHLGRKNE